jgi:Predicted hydrolases or acyltransferases (alpha/beta hydrolase superfamily)
MPGTHKALLNGVQLHYEVEGHGPPLFIVSPGWGVGSGYLKRGLSFLSKQFTVVFVDTRGSGSSGRPVDEAKMGSNEMANDLDALRAHLGLPTIALLGHSNGGAIALSFAERYASRLNHLVLIDSQMFGFSASEATQAILASRSADPRYAQAVKLAMGQFSGQASPPSDDRELSEFVGSILPLYLRSPETYLDAARKELLVGQIALYAFNAQRAADAAAKNDQTRSLGSIKVPVLIASGRHDWICPVAIAERLHSGIPDSRLVIFEDSGHFPWIEERQRFQDELLRFLKD